jgi:hypothetical protein
MRRGFWLLSLGWLLLCSSSWAAVVVFVGQNFTGSTLGVDSTALPPDSNGAAGPDHFVEFINGRFSVYSKTNGARVQTKTDRVFWSQAGVTVQSRWQFTDPRIVFDSLAQRWFAVEVDLDSLNSSRANHFLLAVSATADPTGAWNGVLFTADPGGVNFADFPTLGVDPAGVYLSADLFDPFERNIRPLLVSIPKANLLTATPTAGGRTSFTNLSYSTHGEILQPAVRLDAGPGGAALAVGDLGLDFNAHTTLKGVTILNAASNATLSAVATVDVSPYEVPINPPQPDGSSNLDDGDTRFGAAVQAVGDVLYAVHGSQVNNRAAIRWYRISATDYSLLESGTISDTNLHFFFPSIAANAQGTVVIGFNGCSANTFVGSYAAVGQTVNGLTAFNSPRLLKAGVASYQNAGSDGVSRWGDYGATSTDPADTARFWTIQAIPTGPSTWSTQITELITGPPSLAITLSNSDAVVSWPAYAAGFQLQSNAFLNLTNAWNAVAQPPITNGNRLSVQLPASDTQTFFRLKQVP